MPAEPQLSVVVSTYNRAAQLHGAVESLLQLDAASPPHEVIIVDNNSKDDTRRVVDSMIPASGGRLRYLFEGRQGLSHARNAGAEVSRGQIVLFTDDDVRVRPDVLIAYAAAFRAYPDVAWMGGKVLPIWPSPPPAWLTREQWAPLATIDHGDEGFLVTQDRFYCLVGANLAVRREVLLAAHGFDPNFQHVGGAVTACEDHEFELRLVSAGHLGRYEPTAVIHAEVQPNRLTLAYHRRWHFDHGRALSQLAPPGYMLSDAYIVPEALGQRKFRGVPLYLYRAVATGAARALFARARRRGDEALTCQFDALEAAGAIRTYLARRGAVPRARAESAQEPSAQVTPR